MKIVRSLIIAATFMTLSYSANAQEKLPPVKVSPSQTEQQQDSVYYACTMHQDITADKPGTCSKCNMPLEKKAIARSRPKDTKIESVKTYACPMHPDVKSDKPAKCTKCGMDLVIDEKTR